LLGRIFDDRGNRMTPSYAVKQGVRYRYYVSCVLAQGRKGEAGSLSRIPATEVEAAVVMALKSAAQSSKPGFVDGRPEDWGQFEGRQDQNHGQQIIMHIAGDAATPATGDGGSGTDLIERYLERVVVSRSAVEIAWRDQQDGASVDIIRIPWTPAPRHSRREIILPGAGHAMGARPQTAETRNRLLAAIALGRRWVEQMMKGGREDIAAIALREGKSERAVRRTLSLAFLSPDIVRGAVEGKLPRSFGVSGLSDLPLEWAAQRRLIGALGAGARSDG
jgi:site-specific DNA recombinase